MAVANLVLNAVNSILLLGILTNISNMHTKLSVFVSSFIGGKS